MYRLRMADIGFAVDGSVATITLHGSDAHNRLSPPMSGELRRRLQQCDRSPHLRVVVLRGAGDLHFSAGTEPAKHDVPTGGSGAADHFWYGAEDDRAGLFSFRLAIPVVAAIRGACFDEALCVVGLHASLRVASPTAHFGFPRVRQGKGGALAVWSQLARQIPQSTLMRMIATGTPIDARSALRVGLLNEVVADEQLMQRAYQIAVLVSRRPTVQLRAERQALAHAERMTPKQAAALGSALAVLGAAGSREAPNGAS
jgi:enoyl-CoA hydratase